MMYGEVNGLNGIMNCAENGSDGALQGHDEDGLNQAANPDQDDPNSYGNEYEDFLPQNEFDFINSVVCDGIRKEKEVGISTLCFDPHEELLWTGTKSGHVTSYYGTNLQKYTSFQVHPTDEVRNMLALDQSLIILTQTSVRSQMRRGIPLYTHTSDHMIDMHSMLFNNRSGRLLLGGMQNKLLEFDITAAKELRQINVETTHRSKDPPRDSSTGTCAILRDHSRFLVSGDVPAGRIHLRDPHSLHVLHSLDAHTGVLSDFDVHGHHLVTCGHSTRHGIQQPDRFLMVYDLRILRAISPIQIHLVPYQLRFLPSMSSRIVVLSSMGQVQLVDTATLSTPQVNLFQVNLGMDGCSTISMDISPSNQCLAFGDTSNSVHLYSSVSEPVLNPFARETEFADPVTPVPPMDIEDELAIYSKVARPFLPPGQSSYASDYWPERFKKVAHRPTPRIDPEILRTMKVVGTTGYARNINNMRRNQVQYPEVMKRLKERGERDRHDKRGQGPDKGHAEGSRELSANLNIPKSYRKVAIKLSKMGSDDFDFDRYNRTGFCGLEASLPNSYSNAMLQILYYTEKLRILILNHTCSRENCICCELSFLFHMMDISPGMPCQSSNFLRCLRTIPEASALGLIFTDQNAVWKSNVPRLIQSWNRFVLQQIHVQSSNTGKSYEVGRKGWQARMSSPMKTARPSTQTELEDISRELTAAFDPLKSSTKAEENTSLFTKLIGISQEKVNLCGRCKETKVNQDISLLCNLVYPEQAATGKFEDQKKSFHQVVCSSLCPEQTTPAWCDKCRKYQTTTQTRRVKSLPCVLSLNCGMDNPQDIGFWQTQLQLLHRQHAPSEVEKPPPVQQPPANVKPCRYGGSCTRPDCKFWHPEVDLSLPQSNDDMGAKCQKLGLSWIPSEMVLRLHENGKVSYQGQDGIDSPIIDIRSFQLYGVCSVILDPSTSQSNNVCASINVGPTYHARVASPVSQWYVFNDFSINMIGPDEATAVNLSWKVPSVLFYQSVEVPEDIKCLSIQNPITADVFNEDKSLARAGNRKRITFMPLASDEMPKKGDLVAIDAEFVTLNQEESELRSDGKVSTIKAAQMTVARITCVRGSGASEGLPFIDDYISTQEQVVDYVTRFSGIKPGDLDANFSQKHLTTLKSTYKKLRYLIDTGCVFIGHGLKNDFKVINVVVPPEQVIDTVHLFHLPHHRMVSLKFLSWHFLGQRIQGDVHDSIEDAVTALNLYKKYLELKAEDRLIEALNKLYDHGKDSNWKTPEDLREETPGTLHR